MTGAGLLLTFGLFPFLLLPLAPAPGSTAIAQGATEDAPKNAPKNASRDAPNDIPGASATTIVASLLRQGIERVGELNLRFFMREAGTVSWVSQETLPRLPGTGQRRSAVYFSQARLVIMASRLPANPESYRPHLELHEAMGALGIADENYMFSTALFILERTNDQTARERLRQEYGRSLFRAQNLYAQGGSSVGNGGDAIAIMAKQAVWRSVESESEPPDPVFFTDFPSVGFEPFYQPDRQFIALEYEIRSSGNIRQSGRMAGAPAREGYEEILSLYFPARIWLDDPIRRPAIVEELKRRIFAIYPANPKHKVVYFAPHDCDPAVPLEFPAVSDGSLRLMQEFRASLIFGCEAKQKIQLSGYKIRSPAWKD